MQKGGIDDDGKAGRDQGAGQFGQPREGALGGFGAVKPRRCTATLGAVEAMQP